MCHQVREDGDGGVKYRLVKDHVMKLALTCDDCECVYQQVSPGGGYYCLEHGELFSECLDRDQHYLEREEGKMYFDFAFLHNVVFNSDFLCTFNRFTPNRYNIPQRAR